jgi:membrane-associated phospholipid phosphatase
LSTLWLILLAIACFAAFGLLGVRVAGEPPGRLDVEFGALRGQATVLAVFFTRLGRWYAVTPIALIAAGAAAAASLHGATVIVVEVFVAQVLGQGAVDAFKRLFGRVRPDDWLHRFERGFSYPSGHATTAVVFYGGLAILAYRTPEIPWHITPALLTALLACVIGLPWSRIALGAHYATDVLGGLLFGVGWLCALMAVTRTIGVPVGLALGYR